MYITYTVNLITRYMDGYIQGSAHILNTECNAVLKYSTQCKYHVIISVKQMASSHMSVCMYVCSLLTIATCYKIQIIHIIITKHKLSARGLSTISPIYRK